MAVMVVVVVKNSAVSVVNVSWRECMKWSVDKGDGGDGDDDDDGEWW